MLAILKTVALFVLAALCELGGAYLIWQWQREGKARLWAVLGIVALFLYGMIQTAQSLTFGRAFAAYGGIFIIAATLWGWWVDGRVPDRFDWLGATLCVLGAAVIVWAPRGGS
ncbi:MAG: YnfA family protein [Chloroflexi bacterium]|nr:YnfA family protein [Chloroflexota bacterium]MBI3732824.1 YnfA family protein [Chloroflexota bacterium]